eukprot:5103223-Pleurochrysis_carterae.AAC.2
MTADDGTHERAARISAQLDYQLMEHWAPSIPELLQMEADEGSTARSAAPPPPSPCSSPQVAFPVLRHTLSSFSPHARAPTHAASSSVPSSHYSLSLFALFPPLLLAPLFARSFFISSVLQPILPSPLPPF